MSFIRKHYAPNEYPTNEWYRQHLERNYNTLIFGDGIVKTITKPSEIGNVFNFALSGQSLATDFLVLQQCFSILKSGGVAVFPLSIHSCYCGWKKARDMRPYYWLFWPMDIARNQLELFYIRVAKRFPIIMVRPWDVFKSWKNGDPVKEQHNQIRELRHLSEAERCKGLDKTIKLINEIISFCEERDIIPVFSFYQNGESIAINAIRKVTGKYFKDWCFLNI